MTRRSVKRDVENLQSEILEDLDSEERLKLSLTSIADNKSEVIQTIWEFTPKESKKIRQPEFVKQRIAAEIMSLRAQHDLQRWLLEFKWRLTSEALLTHHDEYDLDPEPDPGTALWTLVNLRFEYDEFASEELDVSLETLLSSNDKRDDLLDEVDYTIFKHRELLYSSLRDYAELQLEKHDFDITEEECPIGTEE